MNTLKHQLTKLGHGLFLSFLLISLLDTTNVLFISPLSSLASHIFRVQVLSTWPLSFNRRSLTARDGQLSLNLNNEDPSNPIYAWTSSQFTLDNGLGHSVPISLSTKTLLSKALSNSMRPSNVRPYHYRAKGIFDPEQVTIATIITSNRLEVFARLAEKYQGPISVAVHVNENERVQEVLSSLHTMYASSETMATYVDIHLIVDSFDRQFNTWRNIARLFARTDFVMMLDIDFFPCTDFRFIAKEIPSVRRKFREGYAALVIPAFEFTDYGEGVDHSTFPTRKADLLNLVQQGRIGMFHASWSPGHSATDYKRFYSASAGEVYKVTRYQPAYEPYVVIKKDGPPWCDERFVGYGGNKAACLFEMYLAGVSFYVLGDHFIIHQNHLYEEETRKYERRYNRKVYSDFKDETCLRYLKAYHDTYRLNSTVAINAITECKKIRPAAKLAAQYL